MNSSNAAERNLKIWLKMSDREKNDEAKNERFWEEVEQIPTFLD